MDDAGNESWEESPLFKKDFDVPDGVPGLDSMGAYRVTPAITRYSGTITLATADSSGDVISSDCAFAPSLILFLAKDDASATRCSNGWSTGTMQVSTCSLGATNSSSFTACVDVTNGINGWRVTCSMDSDGFTLATTKVGAGADVTIKYVAIK